VLTISVTDDEKSLVVEVCHFVTFPVFPDKLKAVEFDAVHTETPPPLIVPATDAASTVTETLVLGLSHVETV
jgi:hypothetical protein